MRFRPDPSQVLVWLLILASAASLLSFFFFLPRAGDVDEMGLFNPVYMKLHYGRMTYPIYYQPETMVVHPPLRYGEVAALMSAGMNLFYAEEVGFTFFAILILVLVACGRFEPLVKVSLVFGFMAGITLFGGLHYTSPFSLRPDMQVAAAWFAGLVLLEDGRLRDWDLKRLGLGAFLVTYASGLHYYAIAAFLAVVPYAIWSWRSQTAQGSRKTIGWLAGGGLAFGLPYLFLFVIPDFSSILKMTAEVQSAGDAYTPFVRHFDHYRYWLGQNTLFGFGLTPFDLAYPAFRGSIPLFLAGSLFLLIHKDTRGIALASLPLCLFIFGYSRAKSAGYFVPEFVIYFSGVALILSEAFRLLWRLFSGRYSVVAATATMVCFAAVVLTSHSALFSDMRIQPNVAVPEMDVARAASKQIVGDDAVVGGRIGMWYVSGAAHWYNIEADLLWRPDISDTDLAQYFGAFDFIAEQGHMSNSTVNERMESVPSWVASGLLNVSGFFFSITQQESNFLMFRPGARGPLRGFLAEDPKLTRFEETPGGPLIFLCMVCGFEQWPPENRYEMTGFTGLLMPKADPENAGRSILPHAGKGNPQLAIVAGILERPQFELRQEKIRGDCQVLNVIEGATQPIDRNQLLAKFHKTDQPIHFYRDYESVVDATTAKTAAPGPAPDLRRMEKSYEKASIEGSGPVRVETGPEQWSFAAFLPIDFSAIPDAKAWLAIKAEVTDGTVGFGIYDRETGEYLSRKFVGSNEARDGSVFLRVDEIAVADGLMIENGAPGGSPSAVTVDEVRILVPAHPALPPRATAGGDRFRPGR